MPPKKCDNSVIISHYIKNYSINEIKKLCHVGKDRIRKVIEEYKTTGVIPEESRVGRPTKIKQHEQNIIIQTAMNPTKSSKQISKELNISTSSVHRIRSKQFQFRKQKVEQKLKPDHIEKRMIFCEMYKRKRDIDKWRNKVLVSDESRFTLRPDHRSVWMAKRLGLYRNLLRNRSISKYKKRMIRKGLKKLKVSFLKFHKGIMVWGCIGKNFKSELIVCPSRMDADSYIDMLLDNDVFGKIRRSQK